MADSTLKAVLAEKREALLEAAGPPAPSLEVMTYRCGLAAGAGHAMMQALEAALSFHERAGLYGNASTEEEPGNCPHDPDSGLHFEDAGEPGEWLCQGKPEGARCSGCGESPDGEYVPWPCEEYQAIAAALGVKEDGST